MKSTARRRNALRRSAFVAVLLAPALTACGFGAQTDQIYQAAQGTDVRSSSVNILNAVIVAQENGTGTFAGTLVNQSGEIQTLSGVTGDGITASSTLKEISLAPRELRNLGEPAPVEGLASAEGAAPQPQLVLNGASIELGRHVRITFEFSGAGKVEVNALVVSACTEIGDEFVNVPLPATEGSPATEGAESTEAAEETEAAEAAEAEGTEAAPGAEAAEGAEEAEGGVPTTCAEKHADPEPVEEPEE